MEEKYCKISNWLGNDKICPLSHFHRFSLRAGVFNFKVVYFHFISEQQPDIIEIHSTSKNQMKKKNSYYFTDVIHQY